MTWPLWRSARACPTGTHDTVFAPSPCTRRSGDARWPACPLRWGSQRRTVTVRPSRVRVSTAPGCITPGYWPCVRTLIGVTQEWSAADEGRHDASGGVEQWSFAFDGDVTGQIVLALAVSETRASFLFDGVLGGFGRIVVADET